MYKILGLILLCALAGCSRKNTFGEDGGPRGYLACPKGPQCVSVQLLPITVEGLVYRCDVIYYYTDPNGLAHCPNGSTIEFLLATRDPKSDVAVSLGFYKLPTFPLQSALVRIVPSQLTNQAGSVVSPVAAKNITRLLLSLSQQPVVTSAPVNSVRIDEDDTDNLDSGLHVQTAVEQAFPTLSPSFAAFSNDETFVDTYQPLLDALVDPDVTTSGTFASSAAADALLQKAINLLMVGIYRSPLPSPLSEGILSEGDSDTRVNVSQITTLVNRDNEAIGYGFNWDIEKNTTDDAANYLAPLRVPYQKMRPAGVNATFNPITNFINSSGYDWNIIDALDESQVLGHMNITQGKLLTALQQATMVGTELFYRLYNALESTDSVPQNELGKWSGSFNGTSYQGRANVLRFINATIASTLDVDIWKTSETVSVGQSYAFPLHVRLTFRDIQGVVIPFSMTHDELGVTFLEDGNIISDVDQDCSVAASPNYQDVDGDQEYRVGLVRAVGTEAGGAHDKFVSFAMLLSGAAFNKLDGMELGMDDPTIPTEKDPETNQPAFRAGLALLNISSVLNAVSGNGSASLYGVTGIGDERVIIPSPNWENGYNTALSYLYNVDGTKRDSNNTAIPAATPDQVAAVKRPVGTAQAELTPCYVRKVKMS